MSSVPLPTPEVRTPQKPDGYGFARMPRGSTLQAQERIDRLEYGRFRNVYLYITEACQLRCEHCYMGERLERAKKMTLDEISHALTLWRRMGGSKLTILGGEPTLHPAFVDSIRIATRLGYEHVITTTNALAPSRRKFRLLAPSDFAYIQISLDGGSASTHDRVRGQGRFAESIETVRELCQRGFDTRIICTVNRGNKSDAMRLLGLADEIGVSLVKYHVFSSIGRGHGAKALAMEPTEWIDFYGNLEEEAGNYRTRVWYQPTYARRSEVGRYQAEGFQGCIGRTLDRISVFPDGRCYVCSYLFDTDLHFAEMVNGRLQLNAGANELDLFTSALTRDSCGSCKASACGGGCPAEEVVMGASSCSTYDDIVPICRLWKSSAK